MYMIITCAIARQYNKNEKKYSKKNIFSKKSRGSARGFDAYIARVFFACVSEPQEHF